MSSLSKAFLALGTVATLAVATPAFADPHRGGAYRHHDRGGDAGAIIAGALILGGIVAIASSGRHRDRHRECDYDDDCRGYYRDNNYRGGYYEQRGYDYQRGGYYNQRRGYYSQGYGYNGYNNYPGPRYNSRGDYGHRRHHRDDD